MVHEFLDPFVRMIIRDVRVQLAPYLAFDSVVIRKVRRQEVRSESPAVIAEPRLHTLAAVNRVVVQDDVDPLPARIRLEQLPPSLRRQRPSLFVLLPCHRCHCPQLSNPMFKETVHLRSGHQREGITI